MSFPVDRHHKAYVCTHVYEGKHPIFLVSRPEGDWCFLCGEEHDDDASAYKVVGIHHVLESDPSLESLSDLQPDWEAERSGMDQPWLRTKYDPDRY